jgi:hypothetical protein
MLLNSPVKLIQMNAYTKQRLGIAEKKLPKGTWIKAKEVKDITGWNKEKMRKARLLGWIEWEKNEQLGFIYNLHSIPKELIKKTA